MEYLPYLREMIYERYHGFHDYKWLVSVTIPAGTKIRVDMYIPKDEIWLEKGYELDVDTLDVIRMSHLHDGRVQFEDLPIGETTLSLPYAKFEVVETIAIIFLENTDTVNDHSVLCSGFYRVVPREVYIELRKEIIGK